MKKLVVNIFSTNLHFILIIGVLNVKSSHYTVQVFLLLWQPVSCFILSLTKITLVVDSTYARLFLKQVNFCKIISRKNFNNNTNGSQSCLAELLGRVACLAPFLVAHTKKWKVTICVCYTWYFKLTKIC